MKIILSLAMLCVALMSYAGQNNFNKSYRNEQLTTAPVTSLQALPPEPSPAPAAEIPTAESPQLHAQQPGKASAFKSVRQALSLKKQIRKIAAKDGTKENKPMDPFAIIGFVFGVLALMLFLTIVFPFFTGLLAVIFSAIGISRTSKGEYGGKGFAIAGLVLGITVILLFWLLVMLFAAIGGVLVV